MNRYIILSLIFSLSTLLSGPYPDTPCVVVIKIPVDDWLGKPSQDIDPSKSSRELYDTLAFQGDSGSYSCPRLHQCLYNEVGTLCM